MYYKVNIYIKTLILLLITLLTNCSGNSEKITQDIQAEEESTEVLKAFRTKDGIFANNSRNMKSSVVNSNDFDQNFPGTNVSCGYILRYYFYTNIHLNSQNPMLITMDGTEFDIDYKKQANGDNIVLYETKVVINLIKGMYFGNSEFNEFIEQHPEAQINF